MTPEECDYAVTVTGADTEEEAVKIARHLARQLGSPLPSEANTIVVSKENKTHVYWDVLTD